MEYELIIKILLNIRHGKNCQVQESLLLKGKRLQKWQPEN
jgi:hypothetical protein